MCASPPEVRARGAEVRHEHGVADEHCIADLVGHAGRRVARRIDHLRVDGADLEMLAVLEQVIKLRAVARHVHGVEYRTEDALHVTDMLADRHLGAGLELDIGRARQMVGMRVRLQHHADLNAELFRLPKMASADSTVALPLR
jgi:hypothetical protein